jgi:hypothetical protein
MCEWFLRILGNLGDFSPERSVSRIEPCSLRPTVEVSGRAKEFYDEVAGVKAFGHPWHEQGRYLWNVESGDCQLSSLTDSRIEVRCRGLGTVRLRVIYIVDGVSSEPAFHTIKFVVHPVYVVGGGAAGLKAAEHLLSLGYKVVLCEATGRLGGRARTEDAVGGAFKVDLGCQWLHGDEWRWELAQTQAIQSLGFRIDDQRSEHPQLAGLWNWPEDSEEVLTAASEHVSEALEDPCDQQPAAVHVPAFGQQQGFPGAATRKVYADRRAAEVDAALERLVQQRRMQNQLAATQSVQPQQVQQRATALARSAYVSMIKQSDFAAQAELQVPQETEKRPAAVATTRNRLFIAAKREREQAFDQDRVPDKQQRIEAQEGEARRQLEAEELARLETGLRDQSRNGEVALFDQNHQQRFATLCRVAYELERAKLGPLEEAAEYAQFSNIDLNEHATLGTATEAGCAVIQSGENAWYLGGYGGLIASYGDHLQATYGAKLWVRRNTRVSRVTHGNAEVTLTVDGRPEKASAVIVTVSTGVVNSGRLTFHGQGAQAVTQAYALLPMGNYKKVVLVLDRDVTLAAVANAQGDAGTHRGSSVYWYLDGNTQLWKFIVPDINRSIVITIVGGALATALDQGNAHAVQQTRAALQAAGVITGNEVVRERFVSTWMTEPEFLGAYSYTAPNGGGAREALIAQPLGAHGVFLAGEALFVKYGTAHGAYITGLRAAKAVDQTLPRLGVDRARNMD